MSYRLSKRRWLFKSCWMAVLLSLMATVAVTTATAGDASAQGGCTLGAATSTNTVIPQDECEAMVALYNSTNGPGWDINTGWTAITTGGLTDPCTWHGVACASDQILILDLLDNSLSGSLPVELGGLASLQVLVLSSNDLSGPIPAALVGLSNLEYLSLWANGLSGPIPVELSELAKLQHLALSINSLSGEIPAELGELALLTGLFLADNDLTGSIPAELGGLSDLRQMDLGANQLSGEIPPELGDLSSVFALHLFDNDLSGSDLRVRVKT